MKTRKTKFQAAVSLVAAVAMAVSVLVITPGLADAGGDYVRVCTLYGARFYYIPHTDICLNVATNDARQQTPGGTWRWRVPNNEYQFFKSPKAACKGGKLIELGEFSASDLTENVQERYETERLPLELTYGQYLASVIYQGGFTGVGNGNFCLFYYSDDPVDPDDTPLRTPIGCVDTGQFASTHATIAYTPDRPLPAAASFPIDLIAANGDEWDVASADAIGGTLSMWLCLKKGN